LDNNKECLKIYDIAVEELKSGNLLKAKKMIEGLVLKEYSKAYPFYTRICYDLNDFDSALKYGTLACEYDGDDQVANAIVGNLLFNHFEYSQYDNAEKAFPYYKRAADLGDKHCAARVGYMYCFGEGVNEDQNMARKYNKIAAKEGHVLAKFNNSYTYYREKKNFRGLFTMMIYIIPLKLAKHLKQEDKYFMM